MSAPTLAQWEKMWRSEDEHRFSKRPLPLPTRPLEVGDRVEIGNLNNVYVECLFDEGRYVGVSFDYRTKNTEPSRDYDVWEWFEVFKWKEERKREITRDSWVGHYMTTSLSHLIRHACDERLRDNPDYQRGYVWTLKDKQSYIRSCLTGLDIGKFILLKFDYPDCEYEVLDGKQRLSAIKDYYLGKFEVDGRYYYELTYMDRYCFRDRLVQLAELDGMRFSKADALRLFLELNVAGVPQTEEHLAHVRALLAAEEAKEKA